MSGRYIAIETAISVAVNTAFSAGFAFLVFHRAGLITPYGAGGYALDFLPQTFAIGFMSVLVPSLLTHARLRKGLIGPTTGSPSPSSLSIWARALASAVLVTVLVAGPAVGLCLLAPPLTFETLLPMKMLYGGSLALWITPVALGRLLGKPSKPLGANHRRDDRSSRLAERS